MKLNKLPPKWTGILLGKMHNFGITRQDIADCLGQTKSQITMVLNGDRRPKDAKKIYNDAFEKILGERNEDEK